MAELIDRLEEKDDETIHQKITKLREQGNEYFRTEKHQLAEEKYTEAIALLKEAIAESEEGKSKIPDLVVCYTNRSASRIGLAQHDLALEDANSALQFDELNIKAYFRKSSIYEQQGKFSESFMVWKNAHAVFKAHRKESDAIFKKQFASAQQKYIKQIRTTTIRVVSIEDLLARFDLLTDRRERLSTLAHFWNDSSKADRFEYFQLFLSIIQGAGGIPSSLLEVLSADIMEAMPMHNYPDFPRQRLHHWFDFFQQLDLDQRRSTFRAIWELLTDEERDLVVLDLKVFIGNNLISNEHASTSADDHQQQVSDDNTTTFKTPDNTSNVNDDDVNESDIDFSYRQKL